MKRLLSTTAALSLAFAPIQPWPLLAQGVALSTSDDGTIVAEDGTVLCFPTQAIECDLADVEKILAAAEENGGAEGRAEAMTTLEEGAKAAQAQAKAQAAIAQAEADAETAAADAAQAEADAAADAAQQAAEATEQAAQDAAQAEADAAESAAAQAEADAAAQAEADAAAQAEADAAAQAEADAAAQAEADAAAQAEADAAAQAEADAAAQAEADAAAQAEADATAQAEAAAAEAVDQAATDAADAEADAAIAAQAESEAAEKAAAAEADSANDAVNKAATKAADEAAAAALAATEAAEKAAADAIATAEAEATPPAEGEAEADAAAKAEVTAPAVETEATAETDTETVEAEAPLQPVSAEAEAALAAAEAAEAEAKVAAESAVTAPAPEPVDIPVVSEDEVKTLTDLLTNPDVLGAAGVGAAASLVEGVAGNAPTQSPVAGDASEGGPADVTVTTVTEADARSSFEEFSAAPTVVDGGKKKSGLSDLEKVGLVALGALVVGAALSNGREVVANTGDRVVVRDDQGGYQVYKDDDTLLRRPGSTVRTESYNDGSTRSIVSREDGTEVVTIRDASGRVLRRATYDQRGNEVVLIDDMAPEEKIDVSTLPRPREDRVTISTRDENAALKAALARAEAEAIGRSFSLRQVREIKEVRRLAATIDVENITFETNSAVIRTSEARKLADLGRIMGDILAGSPNEVFLIEGHTDAVGSAVSNLTLSDRRAESVALAMTEYFAIPPANLVVQGYGESDLRIATQADERLNRRVAVRVVTPLLRTASR